MSDLVQRLRALVILDEMRSDNPLGREAADRIEALEAALREIADEPLLEGRSWLTMRKIARAALAPEQEKAGE